MNRRASMIITCFIFLLASKPGLAELIPCPPKGYHLSLPPSVNSVPQIMTAFYSDARTSAFCAKEERKIRRAAEGLIRSVAREYLGIVPEELEQFTRDWSEQYACDIASAFEFHAKRLTLVSSEILGLRAREARDFSRRLADKLCISSDFETLAKEAVAFKQAQGLSQVEARRLALSELEQSEHFSCTLSSQFFRQD